MSLVSLIAVAPIRELLNRTLSEINSSNFSYPILVPKQSTNPQRIGTAFDILIRGSYKSHPIKSYSSSFLAENFSTLDCVALPSFKYPFVQGKYFSSYYNALSRITKAHNTNLKIIKTLNWSSLVNKKQAKAAYELAYIETLVRIKQGNTLMIDEDKFFNATDLEIQELIAMTTLAKQKLPAARYAVALNPSFGNISEMVGGADADLIIDYEIIDLKVIQDNSTKNKYLHQIFLYALMAKLGGLSWMMGNSNLQIYTNNNSIKNLSLYSARHGELITWELDNILSNSLQINFIIEFFAIAFAIQNLKLEAFLIELKKAGTQLAFQILEQLERGPDVHEAWVNGYKTGRSFCTLQRKQLSVKKRSKSSSNHAKQLGFGQRRIG